MDAFSELGFPRHPVVDPDEVQRRFDELGRSAHPDAGGDAEVFARLASARDCLVSPARRWRHLLELEWPGSRVEGALSQELMDLFSAIAATVSAVSQFVAERRLATTALIRALLSARQIALIDRTEEWRAAIWKRREWLEREAVGWDGQKEALANLAREAAFLEKWDRQLREALLQLAEA